LKIGDGGVCAPVSIDRLLAVACKRGCSPASGNMRAVSDRQKTESSCADDERTLNAHDYINLQGIKATASEAQDSCRYREGGISYETCRIKLPGVLRWQVYKNLK